MASVQEFLIQLRSVFAAQSSGRRFFTLMIVLGVGGALLYASFRNGGGTYAPLFPHLGLEDAGAVVAHLKTSDVDYKLSDNGTTILVPKSRIPELRMELAQLNLPMGGGVGFEWFDKPPIGMTNRVQEINYGRALQGELARSISTLQSVERARVILAMPDRTDFLRTEESKPSASVVLELARGAQLSTRNIEGVLNLVSRSVEGLEPDRVALVDARTGETLNRSYQKPEDLAAEQNLAYQANYESALERDIETMLERWVGKGRVVARVNATFNFRQTTTEQTTYDDDAKAIESETSQADNIEGLAVGTGGKIGQEAFMPGEDATITSTRAPDSGTNGSLTGETIYKVSETNTKTIEPFAKLEALTAAVMVDYVETEAVDPDTGEATTSKAPREDLTQFEDLVQSTVGYTSENSDIYQISVACVPFVLAEETVEDLALEGLRQQEMIQFLVTWGIYGLLGLLAVLFVARPVLQVMLDTVAPASRMQPALADGLPGEAAGQLENEAGAERGPLAVLGNENDARRALGRAETKALDQKIGELLQEDPKQAAALIRKWLGENA